MADILSTVMNWQSAAVKATAFAYGLFTLATFTIIGILDGVLFRTPSEKTRQGLAAAQKKYWDLHNPPKGLKHHFHTLKDGTKLHYVTAASGSPSPSNLVVFIHGFPDSWVLWKYHLLSSKLSNNATLVALDLPGYGGSDDLTKYNSTEMLEAVTQFILAMKAHYLQDDTQARGKTIVVCHDWGTIIGGRLASEAPQLADRFILTAAALPSLWLANLKTRWTTFLQMIKTWRRNPRSVTLLKKAVITLLPLLSQLQKSGYVFAFNLPNPIIGAFGRIGGIRWFYAMTHGLAFDPSGRRKLAVDSKEAAEFMATSMGPSAAECASVIEERPLTNGHTGDEEALAYPVAVRHRVRDGGWSSKIRLYREGLIWGTWRKSMDTLWQLSQEEQANSASLRRSSSNALFDSGPEGSMKAQATILWGSKDPAGEAKVTLQGVQDYLVRGSQVFVLEKAGHWMPVETRAKVVLEEVVEWALGEEKTKLKDVICSDESYPIKLMAER